MSRVRPLARDRNYIRRAVIARDGGRCRYCGRKCKGIGARDDNDRLTIDHVVPKRDGGAFVESNLVVACNLCNKLKGAGRTAPVRRQRVSDLVRQVGPEEANRLLNQWRKEDGERGLLVGGAS